jgi:hypothetical protein
MRKAKPTYDTTPRCGGTWDSRGTCTACGATYHCAHGGGMNVMASGHWDAAAGVWRCIGKDADS